MSILKVKKIKSTDNGPLILDGTIIISGTLITNNVVISGNTCNCSGNTDNINSININNSNLITTKDISSVDINNSNLINTQNLSSTNIDNSNLINTQNLSSVNINNGNLITTEILSANTVSANTLSVNNLSINNLSVQNIETENITINGSINAETYYGDGSNLTGIPFTKSLGQNSLKQVGVSYDKNNFGLSSASLGDFNSSNGNYSVSLGYNNSTGSKPYDFLPSYSGKYGIILDPNAAKDFSTQQTPQSLSTTAITTGITVISSTTIISNTVFIQNGVTGCTRYYLQNNKDENFTVVYTDCDTGLSARTTLNAFSNIEVCSLTRPCIDHYRALDIKLYEDGSPLVLGDDVLENELINYALCQGYNVIQIYGLYGIFNDQAASARLDIFLNKLYTVGLLPTAIMGCGTAGFDLVYIWETTIGTVKFWGVNKECEFWNGQEPFATWINSINYINTTYPNRWNVSAYVANPGANNWGSVEAAQMIAANMDVIQCTDYRSNLPQEEPDPSHPDFLTGDLQLLANAAKNANVIQDFVPLWSSEPVFAGPYFGSFPPNLTVPINRYNLRYNNLNFNNEDSVCKIGFNMFRYEEIINYLPYSLCNVVGTGLTPTTSYAELSGHTKIIDIIPITGCCNYISYTTYTSITTTTTIITGSTQIIPSNSSNPLCIRYSVYYLSLSGNTRPGRIFYTDCTTGRRKIYFAPATPPSANTINYICSLTYPSADLRLDPSAVGIKPHSICCECIQYRMTGFNGVPIEPVYLSYTPCGSSTPIDVTYNYGDIICMNPFNYSSHYFYYIPYFTPSGPVIVQIPSGNPYFLENTNICCTGQTTSSYVISSSTTVTTNIYTLSACTNLSITNVGLEDVCNVYVIQNNTFFNPSFSYINCYGEYQYVSNLLNPFEEIRISSLVEPTIYLNPDYGNYLNNIVVTNLGNVNNNCVTYKFTKIEYSLTDSLVNWTDCYGTLQNSSLKNIGDELTVCLITGSQSFGDEVNGTILGECTNKNYSSILENYSNPDTTLTTISENIYGNCNLYDEFSKTFYSSSIISVEAGYSEDGTIKILGDTIIYSGLASGTAYTLLEFNDLLPNGYFNKIISTSFGNTAIATGENTEAKGNYSFSQNKDTKALGIGSHAEGYNTIAEGDYSHAEGLNTISYGIGSKSSGLNTQSNGEYSEAMGIDTIAGSKNYDFYKVIDGKYVIIFDNVVDQFTTENLIQTPTTNTYTSGTTIISSSTTTYYVEYDEGGIDGCINYSLSNNTSGFVIFNYTDCETGQNTTVSVGPYSIVQVCSLTYPTYTQKSWFIYYRIPVGIVPIGTCCDTIRRVSAITETTITTITTGLTETFFASGCSSYEVTNNLSFPLEVYYTACNNTFTVFLLYSGETTTVCSKKAPMVDPLYGVSAITINLCSEECCKSYRITNRFWWCDLYVYYTDCFTGLPMSASTLDVNLTICSSTYPTFYSTCGYLYPNDIPYYVEDNSHCNSDCTCWDTKYTLTPDIVNGNMAVVELTFSPCDTPLNQVILFDERWPWVNGIPNPGPFISGPDSLCSKTAPYAGPGSINYSGFYSGPSTDPSCNCSTMSYCTHRYENFVTSSVTTNLSVIVTTACTKNTYYTGSTGCTNYIITNYAPNDPNGFGPIISYLNCLGRYESVQPALGQTVTICSSTVPLVNIIPSLSSFTDDVIIIPSGTCQTACAKYRFTRTLETRPINGIWDFSYSDCDFITHTGKLKSVGDFFETCIIIGSEIVNPGITATLVDSCDYPNVTTSVNRDVKTKDITISGLTLTNGKITNGLGDVIHINISNIFTGFTNNGTITISGTTYSGVSINSNYTVLELLTPVPSNINSGKITSTSFGKGAISNGIETQAQGNGSVSQNIGTKSEGNASHAEGLNTTSIGLASHTEGVNTITKGDGSHAEGFNNTANGNYSHAEGSGTTANGISSHAEGILSKSNGLGSHAEGFNNTANGNYSHVEGFETSSIGNYSHAEGNDTQSIGDYSHAEGEGTGASGIACHSEGKDTSAGGSYTHAEGVETGSGSIGSHAEGYRSEALNAYSHAEGFQTKTWGQSSHAEGEYTKAFGQSSHVEGNNTFAGGRFVQADFDGVSEFTINFQDLSLYFSTSLYVFENGKYTVESSIFDGTNTIITINPKSVTGKDLSLSGYNSYSISSPSLLNSDGYYNVASYSHVEGSYNKVFGNNSHAEGYVNEVYGENSHAEGYGNVVVGNNSHAEGYYNTALGNNQHVSGKFNLSGNTTSLFVVGNGTSNENRSDVLQVNPNNVKIYEVLNIVNIQEYPDNSTAILSGLTIGDVYRTGDYLKIVH